MIGEVNMIRLTRGNLLLANVGALVNTVNLMGVMGKGIALQFREAFPENFKAYQRACKNQTMQMGKMLVFPTQRFDNPKYIINFPTKRHWRDKTRLEDIETGLNDLIQIIQELKITTVAVPPLGCGNGGLDWEVVRPLIARYLGKLDGVQVLLYEPSGAPRPDEIPVATQKPGLTTGRSALIYLMNRYARPDEDLTRLEIQKLMYFLQSAGEPLKLNYVRQQYGPYAENLNHVLQRLEGHYLRGYGDRVERGAIHLQPGAFEAAQEFLEDCPQTLARLERVSRLIEGFESPYGMELLATVYWLANEDPAVKEDYQQAVAGFQAWNQRKREHFRPAHIEIAWKRLRNEGWI
jgi:O-acetyl-ADP-ribose deacetylase (regulator of RNase III)